MNIKNRAYHIIFEADSPMGKLFDLVLLFFIMVSIMIVVLDSVQAINQKYGEIFSILEWTITIIFTIEYTLRILVVDKARSYIFSFYGLVDLMSLLPQYVGLFFGAAQSLIILRALRLLRIFRILKITRYTKEGQVLVEALKASRAKISVFLFAVGTLVVIIGAIMYLVEGGRNGFTSIPQGIYWAIVTLTTVGYGDIIPITFLGKLVASIVMIMGYGIIAVPTGIVSYEISMQATKSLNSRVCPDCLVEGHEEKATFCKSCGSSLEPDQH